MTTALPTDTTWQAILGRYDVPGGDGRQLSAAASYRTSEPIPLILREGAEWVTIGTVTDVHCYGEILSVTGELFAAWRHEALHGVRPTFDVDAQIGTLRAVYASVECTPLWDNARFW